MVADTRLTFWEVIDPVEYADTPYADTPIRFPLRRHALRRHADTFPPTPIRPTPLRRYVSPYADTFPLPAVELIDHPQHSVSDFANLARCQEREVEELHEQ